MIDYRLIRLHAPTQRDQQVHINHDGCPAGTDTKRRLYIKNTGTAILAYCHHCNEHRVLKSVNTRQTLGEIKRALVAEHTKSPVNKQIVLPFDAESDTAKWPVAARRHLAKYNVLGTSTLLYNTAYSESLGRLLFPIYEAGELVFVAQRAVAGECPTPTPKWLMMQGSVKPLGLYMPPAGHPVRSDTVVVVEDPISAIKVAANCDTPTLCLFGTALNDRQFEYLTTKPLRIQLFLDGDEAGIKAAIDIAQRLEPALSSGVSLGVITSHNEDGYDPKDYTVRTLEAMIG